MKEVIFKIIVFMKRREEGGLLVSIPGVKWKASLFCLDCFSSCFINEAANVWWKEKLDNRGKDLIYLQKEFKNKK